MGRNDLTFPLPFPQPAPRQWSEAVSRWTAEGRSHKSAGSMATDSHALLILSPFVDQLQLHEIGFDLVDQVVATLATSGRSPDWSNRILSVFRAILKAAMRWRWLSWAPPIPTLKTRTKRVRWITLREFRRLAGFLPDHLSAIATFSVETGLRRSNVTGLTWSQVDLDAGMAWIPADQAKARAAIGVPLSRTAAAVLQSQLGIHPERVFTFRGLPVHQVNTKAWRAALDHAGIEKFRWHDLRHTWASWHAQTGTPLIYLRELGGWKTMRSVERYAHLSTAHLREYVDGMHRKVRKRA